MLNTNVKHCKSMSKIGYEANRCIHKKRSIGQHCPAKAQSSVPCSSWCLHLHRVLQNIFASPPTSSLHVLDTFGNNIEPSLVVLTNPREIRSMVICCNSRHLCHSPACNADLRMCSLEVPDVGVIFSIERLSCENNILLSLITSTSYWTMRYNKAFLKKVVI